MVAIIVDVVVVVVDIGGDNGKFDDVNVVVVGGWVCKSGDDETGLTPVLIMLVAPTPTPPPLCNGEYFWAILFDVLVVELVLTPPLPPLPLLLLRLSIISLGSGVIIVFVVSLEDIVESGCSGGDADSATSNSLSAVANGMNMSRRGNGWFE